MQQRKDTVLSMIDYLSHGTKLRVLDLGSGTGKLSECLVQRGHYVLALDCSENMLQKLRLALQHKRPEFVGAVCAFGNEMCFRDEQFDLILCAGVLHISLMKN